MAAAANDAVGDVFSRLSSVLREVKSAIVDKQLPLCTDDQLNVVRDVTLALRVSENRANLSAENLQAVIDLSQSLLQLSHTVSEASMCHGHVQDATREIHPNLSCHNSRELLTECIRLLRNACVESPANQILISRHAACVNELANFITKHSTSNSLEDLGLMRCSMQFANNAIVGCSSNLQLFWEALFPTFRFLISDGADETLKQYTCCLLYNCLVNDVPRDCVAQLVHSDAGMQTVLSVLGYLQRSDCEWALYIIEKFVAYEQSLERLWSYVTDCQKNILLDVVSCCLKRLLDVDTMRSGGNGGRDIVSVTNLLYCADQFVFVCITLSGLLLNSSETSEQQLELSLARQLLECLCLATSSSTYRELRDQSKLLSCSLDLLKTLHDIGQSGENPLSIASKAATETNVACSPLICGVKSDIIRLIGNLVYQHSGNQNLVRELGGIPLILDHTSIDGNNPFIVQWSVLAIRNLCESNECNQSIIADLHYQGLAPGSTETLRQMGITKK